MNDTPKLLIRVMVQHTNEIVGVIKHDADILGNAHHAIGKSGTDLIWLWEDWFIDDAEKPIGRAERGEKRLSPRIELFAVITTRDHRGELPGWQEFR